MSQTDINEGAVLCQSTPGAVLLDVRNKDEYAAGHIAGSINIPLVSLSMDIEDAVPEMNTPIFVYCRSGARSAKAAALLEDMGYDNVRNIGGINQYKGELEELTQHK